MTGAEAERFLAAAVSEENHALVALQISTGLRPSEALGLKEQHRAKPLDGRHGLIFPNLAGDPLHIQNVSDVVYKRILRRASLPKSFRLYNLRHTCATHLLLAGVHPKVVSDRLGYASISETMDTYSHVFPGMQEGASDKLNVMLFRTPAAPCPGHSTKFFRGWRTIVTLQGKSALA